MKINQLSRSASELQQPIDDAELASALEKQFPQDTVLELTELSGGLFNNTFLVTTSKNQYVLKVSPHKDAKLLYHERFLMERERCLANQLSAVSELTPGYIAFFEVGKRMAFIQEYMSGKLWHSEMENLSQPENDLLWLQLGEFARKLHNQQGEYFGFPTPFKSFERWSDFIQDRVNGQLKDCMAYNVSHVEIDNYVANLPRFYELLDNVTTPMLLHGDIWPRNVIFDGAGNAIKIKAVIDAERAFWGDPVSDWVLILYGVPDAFWRGYGENLVENSDPIRVAVYKGLYFIENRLEAARLGETNDDAIVNLADINQQLSQAIINLPAR